MDLTARVRRAALARPAVLLAARPGATEVRLRLERELSARRWPLADGPAAADLLAVVGDPDPADRQWCEELWRAMPAPRARVCIGAGQNVVAALDEGAAALARDPRGGVPPPTPSRADSGHGEHTSPGHGRAASPEPDTVHQRHGEHEQHGEHASPEGHAGHAGHGMATEVAGLPMADRADDRDGLRLDRLHLPLGPVLPDWPAGLVLRLALQGDVIQRARVERVAPLAGSGLPFWDEPWLRAAAGERVSRGQAARRRCASHLDSVGRLLAVAGWRTEARRARRARDLALLDRPAEQLVAAVQPLVRRVARSRTLRWLTAGLGELTSEAAAAGATGPALAVGGDVWDRLGRWLTDIARTAVLCDAPEPLVAAGRRGPRGTVGGTPPSWALLRVLPGLLAGAEFAAARLIVASLDPDLDELVSEPMSAGERR